MQTNTLPIQVTGPGAPNAPQRNNGASESGADQFSAHLSREMEQRRPAAPAPQPAKPQAAQKPQAADKPAQADARPASQQPADTAEEDKTVAQAPAQAAESDEATQESTAGENTSPVIDMLALMASFKQLQQQAGPTEAAATCEVLAGVAGRLRGQGDPLAGLQDAFHRLARGSAGAAQGTDTTDLGETGAQRPALPEGLGEAPRKGAQEPLDLRAAAQATAQPGGQSEPHGDMPALFAQQARDAAAQLDALKGTAAAPGVQAVAQAQPAVLEAARAVAASNHIPARVGTPGWDNQVGQKIVWMVAGGEQSASLTLNPPDLGPMQVVLNVSGDQASVAFSANQMEVRQALENALPRLREMMSESGIALGNATVDHGMADQRQAQGEQSGNGAGRGGQFDNGQAGSEAAPRTASRTTALGDRGMVDIFA